MLEWTLKTMVVGAGALLAASSTGCERGTSDAGFGNPPRVCVPPPRPATDEIVRLQRVFPGVDIEGGIALVRRPGEASPWYLATKAGTIWRFDDRKDATPQRFVDLSARVVEAAEAGLLDVEFHPDFDRNGEVFVSYNAPGGTAFLSRISRFTSPDGGRTLDPGTEQVVLEVDQPYSNHNGGDIGFGPDGLLYIGLGDGGSAGDPQGHGQNTETLLGAMLRIDVDDAAPYGIPASNPFADGGGRPEIFAWGLRNPWRWSFDEATGALWLGDVGQHMWEEVDVIVAGGNYGWNRLEGDDCLGQDTCIRTDVVEPVAQYRNTGSASVVGGHVYRGDAIADLRGTYVFSDYYFGTIFGVSAEGGALRVLGEGAREISDWTLGSDGEILGIHYDGGVFALVAGAGPADPGDDGFPRRLSQTGCVDVTDPRRAAGETLAYDVHVPFWSDGADKRRFVRVPNRSTIFVDGAGDWDLPVGSVLVKSFFIDGAPVESRLLVQDDEGWTGYGYAWNADGTEAEYVEDHREQDLGGGGRWIFPDSRECRACHTRAAGWSLGLETAQLAGAVQGLVDRGWLPESPSGAPLPRPDDDQVSLAERARAYLHVNCSSCHRPEAPGGRAQLDLLYDTPLADTGLCNTLPRAGDLGVSQARLLEPGDPSRSILSARIRAGGSAHMPPLATALVDEAGATLIDAWIDALTACP